MPSNDHDDPTMKQPSFNGGLEKFAHVASSKTVKTELPPESSPAKTLKRKLEATDDEVEGGAKGAIVAVKVEASRRSSPRKPKAILTQSTLMAKSPALGRRSTRRRPGSKNGHHTNDAAIASPTTALTPTDGPVSLLRDTIPDSLVLLLIGVNPGILTGQTGYAYAHPSNLYWRLLHSSGITSFRHPPSDTYRLPELYCVGNTNIVTRATRDASQLSRDEMNAGVPVLEEKVSKCRPEAVCLVGKGIWEAVWRVRKGRNIKKQEFRYGWQDESENMGKAGRVVGAAEGASDQDTWPGARVFVATTTSGLAASMSLAEKQAVWNELGSWVQDRREARGFVLPSESQALRVN